MTTVNFVNRRRIFGMEPGWSGATKERGCSSWVAHARGTADSGESAPAVEHRDADLAATPVGWQVIGITPRTLISGQASPGSGH